jgi:hypothetical protein
VICITFALNNFHCGAHDAHPKCLAPNQVAEHASLEPREGDRGGAGLVVQRGFLRAVGRGDELSCCCCGCGRLFRYCYHAAVDSPLRLC